MSMVYYTHYMQPCSESKGKYRTNSRLLFSGKCVCLVRVQVGKTWDGAKGEWVTIEANSGDESEDISLTQ